jgi:catechol 2,3-dioxygenase-like lactoylglutathione lyase family enzyme
MCHPGLDPAVMCAATTGPRLSTTLSKAGSAMPTIDHVVLDVPDTAEAELFYKAAFGLGDLVRVQDAQEPSTGFRGFTLSLVVSQPGTVDSLVGSALEAGATTLKPAKRSLWGYGGVVQAPDGSIWKLASSAKKDTGPATRQVDDVVLLLGVADVKATKAFYADRGLAVAKSYGSKYVEFELPGSRLKLGLYGRRALAKDAGVAESGDGSHRIVVVGDGPAVTDPDGFVWAEAGA